MKHHWKRYLSGLLCLVMVLSMLPVSVWAETAGETVVELRSEKMVSGYIVGETLDPEDVQLVAVFGDGTTRSLRSDEFTLGQCDMSSVGIKTVTATYEDVTTQVQVAVHAERTMQPVDPSQYPESEHNYANSLDDTQTLTVPGTSCIVLTFSQETLTESNYDKIYVYDGDDQQVATYTGSDAAGVTLTVSGDTVKIRLTSDGSVNKYGYAFSSITAEQVVHTGEVLQAGKEATCTEAGLTDGVLCDICGVATQQIAIAALGHDYVAEVIEPTPEANGYTLFTCARCGDSYVGLETIYGAIDSGGCGVETFWNLMENGVLVISGKGTMDDYSLPSTVPDVPWRGYHSQINSITVETGVTSIGAFAFYGCDSLTSVTLPEGLTSIGNYAFKNCASLTSVTLPEGLISIGDSAFYYCFGLTSVTLPEGLTSIGSDAFVYCESLTSVTLPEGLASIGNSAFEYCASLTSVTLPEGLTSIGSSAFRGCISLTSVTLPEGLTSIGERVFYGCDSLTSVTLPEGLTSIGFSAFYNCASLSSVEIPESVTAIGEGAFRSCDALQGIWVDPQNGYYASDDRGVLFDKDMTTLIQAPGGITDSYTAPEGLTSIGYSAFRECDSLSSVTLPEGLTSIGSNAFYDCASLTSVTLPESLSSIGYYAFSYCTSLSDVFYCGTEEQWVEISISSGNTALTGATIYYGATHCAHSFDTSVVAPTCTEDGYTAYACTKCGCGYQYNYVDALGHSYSVLVIEPTPEAYGYTMHTCTRCGDSYMDQETIYGTIAHGSCGESVYWTLLETGELIISGTGAMDDFGSSDAPWNSYRTEIDMVTVEPGVTSIGYLAFCGCSSMASITLPESLTSIGDEAFKGCSSLTSISIPEGVTGIGWHMFSGCSGLTSISLPASVTVIEDWAFYECSSLVSITIPTGVTYIGHEAFKGCCSLSRITIPVGVTRIGDHAFCGCSSLTSITLPEGVTSVGEWMFYGCSSLTSVMLPESVSSIGYEAFCECSALTDITIPAGVTSIGDGAFYSCNSLSGVTLPEGVSSIGDYVFSGCSSLTTITLPVGVTRISVNLFYACSGLTSVSLPESLTSIGPQAFWECSGLTSITIPEGVTSIDGYAFYCCNGLTSITLPASLTSIDEAAFYCCSELTDVYYMGDEATWGAIMIGSDNEDLTNATIHYLGKCSHVYIDEVTAPICTERGFTTHTCSVCGDSYVDSYVDALGHDYSSEVVAPTCTVQGYAVHACSRCSDTYRDSYSDATGHSYQDGTCTACGAPDPDAVKDPGLTLNYPTLSFEDEIIYNVYFTVADMTSVEELGLMILSSRDDAATIEDATALVPGYVTNGTVYLVKSQGVPAANMGDTLYFKVYAKLTDGSYTYSTAGGYNAKAYASSILNGNNSAEMKALVVSMLNYGAQAQLYFGHDTDKLVNDALTAEQQALVKEYESTMMDAIVKADSTKTVDFVRVNSNFKSLYPSVSFDGAFAINFYCSPAIAVDGDMTLYYWDMETMASVDKLSVSNATGSMVMEPTNGMYWGQVAGIAAKQMDKTYYVTCVFESNGETITTGIIPYSLGKYCSDKAAAEGDAQQAFAQATAVYGYYAKQYFAGNA